MGTFIEYLRKIWAIEETLKNIGDQLDAIVSRLDAHDAAQATKFGEVDGKLETLKNEHAGLDWPG